MSLDKRKLNSNNSTVDLLLSAIEHGGAGLQHVPGMLRVVLERDAWRCRIVPMWNDGEPVRFDRFEDFLTTKQPSGAGTTVDFVRKLLRDDPEALELFDRAVARPPGGDRKSEDRIKGNNVTLDPKPEGNTRQRAHRALRKHRPDLLAKVIAEEMSAHAAMVEAGLRRRTLTIDADPERAAVQLRKHFPGAKWRALRKAMSRESD